jgi:hypothetical protein
MPPTNGDRSLMKTLIPCIIQLVVILISVAASWASIKTKIGYIEKSQENLRGEVIKMVTDQESRMLREMQTIREGGSILAVKDHDRIVVLEETYKNMTTAFAGLQKTVEINFTDLKKTMQDHITQVP